MPINNLKHKIKLTELCRRLIYFALSLALKTVVNQFYKVIKILIFELLVLKKTECIL